MRQELELLKELQDYDKRCRELELRRSEHPQRIAEERRELEAKQHALEEQKKAVITLQKAVDFKDLTLKEIEGKIEKITGQLNTVKTNKEYSALLSQRGAEEADKSRLEDEILQAMSQVEDTKRQLQAAAQRFDEDKKAHDEFMRQAEEALRSAEAQIAELRAQRERIKQQVPAEWLAPYERLLTRRDGVALTMALKRVPESRASDATEVWICQGCYMSLTMQTIASLMISDKPTFCKSCGRMLYLEGLPEQAEAEEKT